jgi:hypothetical protein
VKESSDDHVLVALEPVEKLRNANGMGDVREVGALPLLLHRAVRLGGERESLLEARI